MIGLGTILKMAKGGALDKDTMEEIAEQMGMRISVVPLPDNRIPSTFSDLLEHGAEMGTYTFQLTGRMKNGDEFSAVIVLVPARKVAQLALPCPLTSNRGIA